MVARVVSGIIGIGVFLALCFAGLFPTTLAVTALVGLALREFYAAYQNAPLVVEGATPQDAPVKPSAFNTLLLALGVLFPYALYNTLLTQPQSLRNFSHILGVLAVVFALRLRRANATGAILGRLRGTYGLVGLAYIGMLFCSFVLIRGVGGRVAVAPFGSADLGAWLLLWTAVCVWSTDSFAFFVGRSMGKHKLAPKLSPGKTWEGFGGGLAGAVLMGAAFAAWLGVGVQHGIVLGLLAGVMGPLGDLFESALKRELNLKDFGSILPGHGGILDRFDSLLFVAPLAYLYFRYAMHL